jgi:hypothetical protein
VDEIVGVVAGGVQAVEQGGAEREGGDDAAGPHAAERLAVGPCRQVARAVRRHARAATALLLGGEQEEEALPEAVGAHAHQELSRVEVAQQLFSSAAAVATMAMVERVTHGARSLLRTASRCKALLACRASSASKESLDISERKEEIGAGFIG